MGRFETNGVRTPLTVGLYASRMAFGVTSRMLEAGANMVLTQPNTYHLRQERPVDEAHIGMDALLRGRTEHIPELEFTGEAMLVAAALRANRDGLMRHNRVIEIVDMVMDASVDAELSPLVSDENVQEVQDLIRENTAVIDFFPNSDRK